MPRAQGGGQHPRAGEDGRPRSSREHVRSAPSGAHGLDDAHCAGRGTCLQSPPRQRPTPPGTPSGHPGHVSPALRLPPELTHAAESGGRCWPSSPRTPGGLCATRTHRSGLGTGQGSGPQRGCSLLQACRVTPAFDLPGCLPCPAPPPTLCSGGGKMSGFWLLAASLPPAASGTFPERQMV